jgi:signal transduction histidine kinase
MRISIFYGQDTKRSSSISQSLHMSEIEQKAKAALLPSGALMGLLIFLYIISENNYLLFHSIAEIFAIAISLSIFFFSWNAREFLDNDYLLLLGIAYLFIAMIDCLHLLSYSGMGVFRGATTNLPTQLWIAGRSTGALALLVAPIFIKRRVNAYLAIIGFGFISALLLASIFYWKNFPICYLEGVGLTPFKKYSEFLISLAMLVSIGLLWRNREAFDKDVVWLIIIGILFKIISELEFTAYYSPEAIQNLLGHFFRIVSFYSIYRAIIETGLKKPYSILLRKLKQDEIALEERNAELSLRNEELDAFAHTVAHDLMNPVSSVLITAQSLERVEMDRQRLLPFLRGIIDSMNKMGRIIDSLLLLSEVRKVDVSRESIDMGKIVGEAIERLKDMFEDSQIRLVLPESWPDAIGYAPWVEEVWVNYISNAIKYGGQPPWIEISAKAQPGDKIMFCIRDNGKGLTEVEKERLFKPFSKLSQKRSVGHGLGLSIVKRIVEKLDGVVSVESSPGQGSTFCFTLPGASSNHLE